MKYFSLLCALMLLTTNAFAQGLSTNAKDPLEITADGTLEWLRNESLLVARGNALAMQGDSAVQAEILTAAYREGDKTKDQSGMQIWKVTGQQDVILTSGENKAYGQDLVYNLDTGLATLTGAGLKMVSPDQTITAQDKFEYWVEQGRFNALGAAKIVRPKPDGSGTDTLEADKISALLKDNDKGERVLDSLEAIGHVVITTPTEVITGAHGVYKADSNTAELTGGVKIERGPNTLTGTRAAVDLNTNISRIFGESSPTGRVRAVFYPSSEKGGE